MCGLPANAAVPEPCGGFDLAKPGGSACRLCKPRILNADMREIGSQDETRQTICSTDGTKCGTVWEGGVFGLLLRKYITLLFSTTTTKGGHIRTNSFLARAKIEISRLSSLPWWATGEKRRTGGRETAYCYAWPLLWRDVF